MTKAGDEDARRQWAAVCELAGRLAERGVQRVTLISGATRRVLEARQCDLPQVLFEAAQGSTLMWTGGEAVRDAQGWRDARADEAAYG
jgi:hypothetical protein